MYHCAARKGEANERGFYKKKKEKKTTEEQNRRRKGWRRGQNIFTGAKQEQEKSDSIFTLGTISFQRRARESSESRNKRNARQMKRMNDRDGNRNQQRRREERIKTPSRFDSASHDIYIYFWPRSAVVARHQHNEDSSSLLVLLGNACPSLPAGHYTTHPPTHSHPLPFSAYLSTYLIICFPLYRKLLVYNVLHKRRGNSESNWRK